MNQVLHYKSTLLGWKFTLIIINPCQVNKLIKEAECTLNPSFLAFAYHSVPKEKNNLSTELCWVE